MREIKFRAWDYIEKEMYDNVVIVDGNALRRPYFATDFCTELSQRLIPMQYTGLKDKEGREIYEGDIAIADCYPFYGDAVRRKPPYKELNYRGEVYYWEEEAAFYLSVFPVSDRVIGRASGGMLSEYAEHLEIVGNIYENPELLEQ